MQRILGQPRAIETLQAGLRSGRFHHAWIFAGPRGVGKCTTAIELAKILMDPAGEGAGDVAMRIDAGTHPDLHIVRKELALYSDDASLRSRKLMNIPVGVLREHVIGGQTSDGKTLDAPAYRTAAMGHAKVFIIDEAELMDVVGQSALLKTLEEPPPKTYFFLITSRPQRLLTTIHSRCQRASFNPLDDEAMAKWLAGSGLDLDPDTRAWVLEFAHGSPGLATLAAEHGFHDWQKTLDPMLEKLRVGVFPVEMGLAMAELVEGYATSWVKAHDNASKDAANKEGARFVLSILAAWADRQLADAARSGDDPEPWARAIDLIAETEAQLYANVNMKIALENLVVQWCRTAQPTTV